MKHSNQMVIRYEFTCKNNILVNNSIVDLGFLSKKLFDFHEQLFKSKGKLIKCSPTLSSRHWKAAC